MDRKINFSPEAKTRVQDIISYLSTEWSKKVAQNFTAILNNKIKNILSFPKSYSTIEGKPTIRKCVITNQITLYYRISKNEIEIITLFDSRQNPERIENLLQ